MFSSKKIAVVSGILSGLVVTCAGVTQAYAGEHPGHCARTPQGNHTCVQKHGSDYTAKNGTHVVRQHKSCSTTSRHHAVWPENGLLDTGSTNLGGSVDCSNRLMLPKH
ncbi:hypothetical protein SSP35_09_00280 [Streptomyces sp. NBRC 110611]|uniref:hypothetical protein n=1 Tax=Streptomyces sp. NBRC 110611 TaxID=1621259 RepID=UPI00083166E2|nr:hypothetical protein [Streptomyces sp. NBRC 110611]GAU68785.1 hypothetical protein SSP35_09_00280 [Streptomyces sp. NBRC 110611]